MTFYPNADTLGAEERSWNYTFATHPRHIPTALKDVTLTIPAGMYGLLDPNGADKSTLMRILATLQEPDKSSIRLGDTDVLNRKDEVRKTLGYPTPYGERLRT